MVVKNAVDIAEPFQLSSVLIVAMIQPIADTPPIRIFCPASDNRFTAEDVKARMKTIQAALMKEDIRMLAYAADGDSREMKWMQP